MADSSFIASVLPPLTMPEEIEKSHRKTSDGFLKFDLMEIFFATGALRESAGSAPEN
jgi:hypothetical protein